MSDSNIWKSNKNKPISCVLKLILALKSCGVFTIIFRRKKSSYSVIVGSKKKSEKWKCVIQIIFVSYLTLAVETLHCLQFWFSKNNTIASILSVTGACLMYMKCLEVKALFLLSLFTCWPLPSPSIALETSDGTCSGLQHSAFALFTWLFMTVLSFVYSLASLNNVEKCFPQSVQESLWDSKDEVLDGWCIWWWIHVLQR